MRPCAELAEAWEAAAWANQIYPLDEGSAYRFVVRPPRVEVFDREVRLVAETPTLERWRSMQLIVNRSATVDIRLGYRAGRDGPGDEGVLLSHGDQGGGYLVWIVAGNDVYHVAVYGPHLTDEQLETLFTDLRLQ